MSQNITGIDNVEDVLNPRELLILITQMQDALNEEIATIETANIALSTVEEQTVFTERATLTINRALQRIENRLDELKEKTEQSKKILRGNMSLYPEIRV